MANAYNPEQPHNILFLPPPHQTRVLLGVFACAIRSLTQTCKRLVLHGKRDVYQDVHLAQAFHISGLTLGYEIKLVQVSLRQLVRVVDQVWRVMQEQRLLWRDGGVVFLQRRHQKLLKQDLLVPDKLRTTTSQNRVVQHSRQHTWDTHGGCGRLPPRADTAVGGCWHPIHLGSL